MYTVLLGLVHVTYAQTASGNKPAHKTQARYFMGAKKVVILLIALSKATELLLVRDR